MNFIPYGKQDISNEDIQEVVTALKSSFLTTGPKVLEFEKSLCIYTGASYCVSVSNGTAALHLASLVLLNKEDKVLTTPNSFLATSNSILYVNAKPIFVDIQKDGNIDLDLCEEYLKEDPSIKAIYAVAFSGNMINQKKLHHLRTTYDIKILEDCAHAIGAKSENVKAGSCKNSDISIFSFHPVKHITSGEGGAITTNSKEIYEKLLSLRNHGMIKTNDMKPWEYEMTSLGYNYRLTDIACALGMSQLKRLDSFINRRLEIAKTYDRAFFGTNINSLYTLNGKSSYHLYVIKIDFTKENKTREELVLKLKEKNIGVQVHYMPINKQPFYKALSYGEESTPIMDEYYSQCLSLPCYSTLSKDEQNHVIKTLKEVLHEK